jgi:hypothetical protein
MLRMPFASTLLETYSSRVMHSRVANAPHTALSQNGNRPSFSGMLGACRNTSVTGFGSKIVKLLASGMALVNLFVGQDRFDLRGVPDRERSGLLFFKGGGFLPCLASSLRRSSA